MDTSTPVRSTKSTCCRNAIIQSVIAEDSEFSSPSVVINSPNCYSPNEPKVERSWQCEPINFNKSTELFPFSPIPCRENVPQTLLPLLDTPNLKWSNSILTPCAFQPQNELSMQCEEHRLFPNDSDSKQESAVYTTSSFPIFDEAESTNSPTKIDVPKPTTHVLNELVSPVMRFNQKSKSKKSSKTVKKLFCIPEDDTVSADISYQRMSDVTMDAFEQLCQISENFYSNPPANSEVGPSSSSSDPLSSSLDRTSQINFLAKPSHVDLVNSSEMDLVFNTSFDLNDDHKSATLFENNKFKNSFVYPFDVGKKPGSVVAVHDVIESVLPLEQYDRVCVTKCRPVPRSMILFSQLTSERQNTNKSPPTISSSQSNLESDIASQLCPSNTWDNPGSNFDVCTFWNYQLRPNAYTCLTRTLRKHRDVYHSLKSFFEVCRIDFARVVSETRNSPRPLGVSLIVAGGSSSLHNLSPYLTNQKAIIRLSLDLLPLGKTKSIRIVEEFFEYFRSHFELVYNGSRINKLLVDARLPDRRKRKRNSRELCDDESRRKSSNTAANQQDVVSIDMSYPMIDSPTTHPFRSSSADVRPLVADLFCASEGSFNDSAFRVRPEVASVANSTGIFSSLQNSEHGTNNLVGFRTASGKRVTIKPQSLVSAEKRFDEVKEASDAHEIQMLSQFQGDLKLSGFGSANGKHIREKSVSGRKVVNLGYVEVADVSDTGSIDRRSPRFCITAQKDGGSLSAPRKSIGLIAFEGKSALAIEKKFTSFSTTSESGFSIDAESRAVASKLLEDIEKSDFLTQPVSCLPKDVECQKDPKLPKKVKDCIPETKKRCNGFSTAAGEPVNVKRDSLIRAEALLQSISDDLNVEKFMVANSNPKSDASVVREFPGFSTAAGKQVHIKEQSLARAESLLKSVSEDLLHAEPPLMSVKPFCDQSAIGNQLVGFSTAAGKPVPIKEQSLAHAEALLKGISEDLLRAEPLLESVKPFCDQSVGFSTAAGKPVPIKEQSLAHAEALLKGISEDLLLAEPPLELVTPSSYEQVKYGSTSGDPAAVEERSFIRGRALLEGIPKDAALPLSHFASAGSPPVPLAGRQFPGFCTAAGERVHVDEQSLADAETLLKNVTEETHCFLNPAIFSSTATCSPSTNIPFSGFSTAAGKPVDVKESSLARAETLLRNVFEKTDLSESGLSVSDVTGRQSVVRAESTLKGVSEETAFEGPSSSAKIVQNSSDESAQLAGFSTASGKKVNVDARSLARAESWLRSASEDVHLHSELQLNPVEIASNSVRRLAEFSTAAGRLVGVKEQSLARAEALLKSVDNVLPPVKPPSRGTVVAPSANFGTTAGQPVSVQEPSLAHTKALFERAAEKIDLGVRLVCPGSQNHVGFISAAGRRIHVNEQTLACAVELMNRAADDPELCSVSRRPRIIGQECRDSSGGALSNAVGESVAESVAQDAERGSSVASKKGGVVDEELSNLDVDQFFASDSSILDDDLKPKQSVQELDSTSASVSASNEVHLPAEAQKCYGDTKILNERLDCRESNSHRKLSGMNEQNQPVIDEASPSYFDSADESGAKPPPSERSKPPSPVFETSRNGRQKRLRKRRSQSSVLSLSLTPLNVMYGRKENDSLLSDKTSPEDLLKKFKDNLAQKCSKRKEAATSMISSLSKRIKEDAVEQRLKTTSEQQKYVAGKCREDCKPREGWFLTKKLNEKRISLSEAVRGVKPARFTSDKLIQLGIKPSVVAVDSANAGCFVFTSEVLGFEGEPLATINCGDECTVIPNEKNEVRFEDLSRAFLASPGVDPKLITETWIRNHYRWIVWKLASVEKSYPQVFGGKYLTLDHVLHQLKFRYDRELDRCERSALKRILECDDSASKPMVLCVATVKPIPSSLEYELELTDGWYSVWCQLDVEMHKLVSKKKVAAGTKLIVMNAELMGLSEGCDPLQVCDGVRLKVATNSTRRVRWDTRLGFHGHRTVPVIRDLRNVLPNGGMITQLSAAIARIYPLLYMEKSEGGYSELYNEKVEFKKVAEYERRKQACLESLASQVMRELQKENYSSNGDEWYRNGRGCSYSDSDLVALQAQHYGAQEKMRCMIQEKVEKKLPEEFRGRRQSLCLLKARLVNEENEIPTFSAVITVWHPTEDVISLLTEGKVFTFHNVNANDIRNGELRLSSNRMTRYEVRSFLQKPTVHQRRLTAIGELNNDFLCAFGEVDTVGVVIDAEDADEQDVSQRHTVYLADLAMNIVAVKFRSTLKDFGFDDTLKRKRIVAGVNLQWKRGSLCWKIPVTFATECSLFVHKSRHQHLQCSLDELDSYFKTQCLESFVSKCEKKLLEIIRSPNPVATSTPLKVADHGVVPSVAAGPGHSSLSATATTPDRWSMLDLSASSSWSVTSKCVQSRIDKLRGYGEPPPLSPITMTVRPKRAKLSIQTHVSKLNEKT